MESNVAFKAYLFKDKSSETHDEVRWFHVDQNAVVSFELVKQKLKETFPRLEDKEFKLYWKDCDDDLVLISSDTELIIALTNTTSEPRRLYIYLVNAEKPQSTCTTTNPSNTNDVLHIGVICDGCGGEVCGFRYKCIECPDFDLCSRCEASGVHSEHCFLRLTDFLATKRLRKCLSAGRKMFKHAERDSGKHGKRHGSHMRHGWYELLSQFLAEPTSNVNEDESKNGKEGAQAENSGKSDAPKGSRCPFVRTDTESSNKEGDCHVNYLKNIGQTIASLLDPLGIDVDVEVRSKNNSDNKTESETQKQSADKQPTASTSKTQTTDSAKSSDSTSQTNRAVPVFPPGYVPIYMDTNVHTPVVQAFVNGQPVDVNTTQSSATNDPSAPNPEPQVSVGMSAFVNGVPMFSTASAPQQNASASTTTKPAAEEANKEKKTESGEGGWTLLDDGESSTSSEDNSTSETQNAGDGDSARKQESNATNDKQQNKEQTTGSASGPQPTFAGMFTNMPGGYPGFPPMPPQWPGMGQNMPGMNQMPGMGQNMPQGMPVYMPGMPPFPGMHNYGNYHPGMQGQNQNAAPMPGFNFDTLARDLQKHLQTHFKDAMSAASNIASNVAANTVNNLSNSRRSSTNNGENVTNNAESTTPGDETSKNV